MTTINNQDLLALKSYITAADSTQYSSLAATTLVLDLTHSNLKQRHVEIRFDKHDTVDELRRKIHQKTGTPEGMQHLQFKNGDVVFYEIPPNYEGSRKLGYFDLPHGTIVHCIDINPHSQSANGAFENTALVERYVMSEEEYDKRRGTLRDWGRKKKEEDESFSMRKHAREHAELVEARRLYKESGGVVVKEGFEVDEGTGLVVRLPEVAQNVAKNGGGKAESASDGADNAVEEEFGPESISHLSLHSRCQVQPGSRRGIIAYLGPIPELGKGGNWVGVILDEPVGKTDGTVSKSRKKYFEAPGPTRGGFFRGKNVEAGDFPEIDIMAELEDSEDEL